MNKIAMANCYLSVITLNIKGLKSPVKKKKLPKWQDRFKKTNKNMIQ